MILINILILATVHDQSHFIDSFKHQGSVDNQWTYFTQALDTEFLPVRLFLRKMRLQ